MCIQEDIIDNYAFHFLEDVEEPFVQLIAVGREARHFACYHLENRKRESAYLFQYTLKGSGTVKIQGQEYLVEQGKAFFLKMPGPESYYFDEANNQAPWEFIYAMFECHGAERYCQQIESRQGQIFTLPIDHDAIQLLFEMHVMAREGKAQNPFLLSSMVFAFLCHLCAGTLENTAGKPSLSARAGAYIQRNCSRPIGISEVAAFLKVSNSHLSREFVKDMGVKPVNYLTRARLDKAVDLLTTSKMSIQEIGIECGFSGANYFGKVFRKYMGMAPAQFREYVRREGFSRMQI